MGSRRVILPAVLVALSSTCAAIAAPPAASSTATPTKPAPKPAPPAASPSKAATKTPAKSTPSKTPASKTPAAAPRAPRATDSAVRRQVAGGPTFDDAASGADTPELRALYAAERELFPPASPLVNASWPDELPFPVPASEDRPRVHASGLPPTPPPSSPQPEAKKDLSWLSKLDMPDLPIRWDARVVRYLEFFKDDPRGRSMLTTWLKRSGRYRDAIRKVLRKKGLPEDLTWLAMIESGFDPSARSPVGALGLWQFMPDTGKIYGLTHDRWADQRMNPTAATEAAADFLADLYRRFGSWDLAMAGYNMGHGGLLAAVRRYNTNDYWALAKLEGSLPWETTLYVPKILAAAIVSRNLGVFGFQDVQLEAPIEGEEVMVKGGTSLATVAQACGTTAKEVEALNPELRASRTPPSNEDWAVKVPVGKASGCSQRIAHAHDDQPTLERYVVRFGESIDQIAQAHSVSASKIVELNAIAPGEVIRGGTVLLLPRSEATADKPADPKPTADKPVVVVPQDVFVYPDRARVFYRVQVGDSIPDICAAFKVTADELRRWNDVDTSARLVEGMMLQVFVPQGTDLSKSVVLGERDVHTIVAGTDEFFAQFDDKGRRRVVVTAKAGETLADIGKRNGISSSMMERINRRSRSEKLREGERIVLWLPGRAPTPAADPNAQASLSKSPEPAPTEPLASPPAPDQLPPLP